MDRDPARGWRAPSGDEPAAAPADPNPTQGAPGHGQDPPPSYPPQYGPPQYGPPPVYAPPPGYAAPPGYGQPFGQPFADKPGVIPLRPLAVGEILDGAFATIRANVAATLGLTFLIVLVGQLVVLAVTLAVRDSDLGIQITGVAGTTIITQLMATIATGSMIVVISEAVLGTKITPSEALERLRGRIWRLVGLGFLVALLSLLGLVLIFIGYIWVAVLLSLAAPVFILEKTTVSEALNRSYDLVRGSWWRTFGIGLLGYIVGGIIGGLIQLPFTLVAGYNSNLFSTDTGDHGISAGSEILITVGRILGGTISTPIIAGTIALIYVDRRIRREGLDLALAEAARNRQSRL